MFEPLHVLLVEDSEDDVLFTLRALEKKFKVTHKRVECAEAMKAALNCEPWDIVISDYNMPKFSGFDAYQMLIASGLILPFILVSGAIGEEIAVEAMRMGVNDYILKGNLARLVPAVSREIQRARVQRRHQIDISERKHAESERDHYFTCSLDLLCIISPEGYFARVNPSFERVLGYTTRELMAHPIMHFVHPEDLSRAQDEMRDLSDGATSIDSEFRTRCKDGTYRWFSWNATMASGKIYASARDVTESRKASEILRDTIQMQGAMATMGMFALKVNNLSLVFEKAVQLSAELSDTGFCSLLSILPDGKTLVVQATVGWSQDAIGLKFEMNSTSHAGYTFLIKEPVLFGDLNLETRFKPSLPMVTAGIASGLSVLVGDDDSQFGLLILHSKQRNKFGVKEQSFLQGIANVIAMAIKRNQIEAQLNTSDRMATVGQLAAGVAHEVNNPLSYVTANLEMVVAELDADKDKKLSSEKESLLTMLRQVQEGVERVRVVVKDLTTYSRSGDDKLEPIQLEAIVDSSIRMSMNQIRHRAKLVKEIGAIPLVLANEARMGQVILNLLINAAHSIPEGEPSKNEIRVCLSTDQDGQAVIKITDTGEGIPPDILPSIFDPFFTTKPIGVGTGLGLSICRNIILKINGSMRVESQVGFGTTIHIVLPPAIKQNREVPVNILAKVSANKRLNVLILDDEKLLGISMSKGLGNAHHVQFTTSPLQALMLIKNGETMFDVIFCDLMMEEMTGMEFFEELRRGHPGLESRIVFMTGGVFTKRASLFLDTVPNLRVLKPFILKEIRDLLQSELWTDPVALLKAPA